jgi:hypothetical protein
MARGPRGVRTYSTDLACFWFWHIFAVQEPNELRITAFTSEECAPPV